jgi:hypothetical protein
MKGIHRLVRRYPNLNEAFRTARQHQRKVNQWRASSNIELEERYWPGGTAYIFQASAY